MCEQLRELKKLLAKMEDGILCGSEKERMRELFSSCQECREYWCRHRMDEVLIGEILQNNTGTMIHDSSSSSLKNRRSFIRNVGMFRVLSVCGLLLAAFLLFSLFSPRIQTPDSSISDSLGRIVRLNNVNWKDHDHSSKEWEFVSKGDAVKLEGGSAEIVFNVGVHLVIEGPAEIDLIDFKRIRVHRGKLSARVGRDGIGFTIETPSGTIVDQGTQFGLEVGHGGEAKVVVFQGNVDFHQEADRSYSLNTGEGMIFRQNEHPKPIVAIGSDYFLPAAIDRLPVPLSDTSRIASISDNIRDNNSKKFYKIVPRGFGEDVPAYVDRLHEWNGVTHEGLPVFLLGADYIQTFNDDKYLKDHQLTVTLSVPARLFVLFDMRSDVPDWLQRDFVATEHLVGLNERFFPHENDGIEVPRKIGPGKGIDNVFTVWERKSEAPGKVVLGSLLDKEHNSQCFYGIVVAPLQGAKQ